MPATLERRVKDAATALRETVTQTETYLAGENPDTESTEYKALREEVTARQNSYTELAGLLAARNIADTPTRPTVAGEPISDMRRVLREYDRGNSERFAIPYEIQRELQTGDPYFTPNPTRIQVAQPPTGLTPVLDSIRSVPVGSNSYDFVTPPPPVLASEVPEGGKKPTRTWLGAQVSGTLLTDAHIIDVTRQTLEDDAAAERTLRSWLVEGVRMQQEAKAAAVIAGATGTLTATGSGVAGALRAGKTALSAIGVRATAAHLNPADLEDLDLADFTAGNGMAGVSTAWGMTLIENTAVTAGVPIVGNMRDAVYFLYRNSIQTYITDSGTTDEATPRDRFSHNILGILAEGRSRTHLVQPGLLVKCTVGAVRSSSETAEAPKGRK